jgi:hypothetical protein
VSGAFCLINKPDFVISPHDQSGMTVRNCRIDYQRATSDQWGEICACSQVHISTLQRTPPSNSTSAKFFDYRIQDTLIGRRHEDRIQIGIANPNLRLFIPASCRCLLAPGCLASHKRSRSIHPLNVVCFTGELWKKSFQRILHLE